MNEIGYIQMNHPGMTDIEEMREGHRENLRRYLDWYGYAGVLEEISQISRIAIGTRQLITEEEHMIITRCEFCDNVIEYTNESCPRCANDEDDEDDDEPI